MKTLLATAAILLAFPAMAQQNCGPVEGMAEHFEDNFGERVIYEAVDDQGTILVFLVNDQTQSWTLVIHDGVIGCIVSAGSGVLMIPTGLAL